MDNYMVRDGERRLNQVQVSAEQSAATELFTFILCHGEECRLDVFAAKKRLDELTGRDMTQGVALAFINSFPKKFEVKTVDGRQFVEAKTSVKLCDDFQAGKCARACKQLHICRFFLQDGCKFGEKCKKPHSFISRETTELLQHHHLYNLPPDALRSLFKKVLNEKIVQHTSESSGPKACEFYNKGVCKNGDKCKFLHDQEKLEICGFNLRDKCQYGTKCNARHTSLPYEWQYLFGSPEEWKSFSLEENREIEKDFCNVQKSRKRVVSLNETFIRSINFQTLMGKIQDTGAKVKIRRLSTVSSVLAASGHVFRTKWKWYWLDEHDKWQSYDDEKTTTNSEKIELDYKSVSGKNKNHKFSCDPFQYTLHFDNPNQLYQENDKHGTKRDVRRRPAQFLDEGDMKAILEEFKRNHQRMSSSSSNVSESQYSVPTHWTPVDASEEFKVVDLSKVLHPEEFTKVETLFLATMAGYKIKSVKRVQNAGLWQDYERQKSKIKKNNSGTAPEERWLFHGTNQDTVDPICQQGFDWRLSGKHGTRYGKGSYFAVEASYSNNYSNNYSASDNRKMFMARAVVGSYVLGDYNTQRPPSKDKSNPLSVLHDSCVDNISKPSIFVVFERSQVYPYYIIDYGT